MDYTDPTHRRLRDEPIKKLSPEEVQIAIYQNHADVLNKLFGFLNTPNPSTSTNEKETPDSLN